MSGGAAVMMADACSARGLAVVPLGANARDALVKVLPSFMSPDNPVDYGPVYGDAYAIQACVDATAADPGIDLLLVFIGLSPGLGGVIEQRLAEVQNRHGKPIVVAWLGGPRPGIERLRSLGVAAFDDPARAVEVAVQLSRAGLPLTSLEAPGEGSATPRRAATREALRAVLASGRTALGEREVKTLLAPYSLPMIPEVSATSAAEARAAALGFDGPVAVKAEAPDLLHKTDAGAVRLRVAPGDAAAAYEEVVEAAARVVGRNGVRGALVQPMAREGLEILAGLRFDPQFGPAITVGLGGVASEVLADVATELAPVDRELAGSMLDRLRGKRLLGAFRGSPPRDRERLIDVLVALSEFAMDAGPLVAELDLNPVIVHAQGAGCTVVDGAAVLAGAAQGELMRGIE
jgi:acyl-CoA synthetase (NDP forming)